jgi:hypothetical protein
MPEYPETFFEKYKSKGILIDTNLMVLIAVGNYSVDRILTFKRTIQYTLEDYTLMMSIVAYFERRITTPHILAEVDNLTRQLPQAEHRALAAAMGQLIANSFEIYVPSGEAIRMPHYSGLGLTDCVTILAALEALVITDDFRLSGSLSNLGRDVININHIRTWGWSM